MTSKSAKLKSHRIRQRQYAGRKPKEGVERYQSGQIKHSEREQEVRSVAVEALDRVHSLPYDKRGYAGFVLGRMFLDGRITECELEAGNEYASLLARYYYLKGIPAPSARAQSLFSVKGYDGDVSENRARLSREISDKIMKLEGFIVRLEDGYQVKATLMNTCVLDMDIMRTMKETQLSMLKRGLQEVHFRLGLARLKVVG
jgi:hypothetical protein